MTQETTTIHASYVPSESEEYMNPNQINFFKALLLKKKQEIFMGTYSTLSALQDYKKYESDLNDVATQDLEQERQLKSRDRDRKHLLKIEEALSRISSGSYGYCEETGEPIGVPRLIARPTATLSIEAQERHEKIEKTFSGKIVLA